MPAPPYAPARQPAESGAREALVELAEPAVRAVNADHARVRTDGAAPADRRDVARAVRGRDTHHSAHGYCVQML